MRLYHVELEDALKYNNEAVAWRSTRRICGAFNGSRRQCRNWPGAQPSRQDVLNKYSKPHRKKVWGAIEISVENMNALDGDFEQMAVAYGDKHDDILYDNFQKCMHYSSNRKMSRPGEVPSEVWKIITEAQWLRPACTY